MLSVSMNTLKLSLSTVSHNKLCFSNFSNGRHPTLAKPSAKIKSISATRTPSDPKQQVYQPFRPPPSPLPSQYRSLDSTNRLEVLANRMGLWYEYAPLIPSLIQEGLTPPSIEEATGISGVEQNRLVVAAQVRESLVHNQTDPEIISAFDTGGAELLYEIRLLNATQRAASARFIIENRFDAKGAQDLARAIKDFPRRRGENGWENFDYKLPGDCLSFMYYRQSMEHKNQSEQRTAALRQALSFAETEKAKNTILEELEGKRGGKEEKEEKHESGVRVPVVRMQMGEVAEASKVVVFPVCKAEERDKEILEAPVECRSQGVFGVVEAEKGWKSWVVLPAWEPVAGLEEGGVVISFADARAIPWRVNRWYKEEPVLVVVDRSKKDVDADDGFYLVKMDGDQSWGIKVERGYQLKQLGVTESLGAVVLVVRPPREDTDDQLRDEDWE